MDNTYIVGAALVLILVVIAYYYYNYQVSNTSTGQTTLPPPSSNTPVLNPPNTSVNTSPTTPQPTPSTLNTPVTSQTQGLFLKTSLPPYTDGLTKDQATSYCTGLGGQLASTSQLNQAFLKGFGACMYGWSNTGPSIVTQNPSTQCSTVKGVYTLPVTNYGLSSKYGAFCYGNIPPSSSFSDGTFAI